MRPTDISNLQIPTSPSVSPDGSTVCYQLTRIDLDADDYRSRLMMVPADGSGPPREFTRGPKDSDPAFSPDGRWIAFRRAQDDGHPQLHVMPVDGGEARQVAEHPLGMGEHAWSPDSRRIAYLARVPEEGRYGTDPDRPAGKEPPRRITTLRYRRDGVGWTIDRRQHVFVVDALDEGAEPLQVTAGDYDHGSPAWHPDGHEVAFVSARHPDRDADFVADVFVAPAGGGDARQVTDSAVHINDLAYDADGSRILFRSFGHARDIICRTGSLYSVPADSSGERVRHTDPDVDTLAGPASGPCPIVCEPGAVVTVRVWRGAVELVRFDLGTGAAQALIDGHRQVTSFGHGGGLFAAVVAEGTCAGEVVVVDADGKERTLTSYGAEFAREVSLRPIEELQATADDGYPVHGWVVKPAGQGPFPVLLNIHGGPYTQYGWRLFDEAQVYAGAGYAVVMGNPRGSQGYGLAHGRAVVGALGDRDEADLLALLDGALAQHGDLDGERVGVMGGSYGGLMTTLLAGRHDRFVAGISERALNCFDSFAGSSDIGATFPDLIAGETPERQHEQSPLTYADGITCPMLIIHSEEDWRCPLEQGQRLFVHLRKRGVPAEMFVFPGEGHELSRSGLPSHRVARFDAILEWWARHLMAGGGSH